MSFYNSCTACLLPIHGEEEVYILVSHAEVNLRGHTVKPPNKGHFGNNIILNSSLLSFVERLSSSRGFNLMY